MNRQRTRQTQQSRRTFLWARAARSPWTVACVVAAVVVGPSAATASALDRANAAPPYSAPRAGSAEDRGVATAGGSAAAKGSIAARRSPEGGFLILRRPSW